MCLIDPPKKTVQVKQPIRIRIQIQFSNLNATHNPIFSHPPERHREIHFTCIASTDSLCESIYNITSVKMRVFAPAEGRRGACVSFAGVRAGAYTSRIGSGRVSGNKQPLCWRKIRSARFGVWMCVGAHIITNGRERQSDVMMFTANWSGVGFGNQVNNDGDLGGTGGKWFGANEWLWKHL